MHLGPCSSGSAAAATGTGMSGLSESPGQSRFAKVMPAHLGLPDENGKHAPAVVGVPGLYLLRTPGGGPHMAWQRSRIVYSTASNHPKYFVTARHVIERLWAQPRGKSGNVVL